MRYLILGFSLVLFGCTGYQYVCSPHYVPVNLEKGDLIGNISFNYLQLGYSLSNNFSIYTTGYYRKNDGGIIKATASGKENAGAYIQTDKQRDFDIGLTYYKKLGDYFSYEIVSGIGNGIVNYSNTQDLRRDYEFSFESKKLSLYVQPDFSFRFDRYFDFTIFSRINQNRYYDINKKLDLGDKTGLEKYDQFFNDREIASLLFFEPGLQFRAGLKNFKFQIMFSRIFDLKHTGIQYRQANIYLGVSYRFNLIKPN